METQRSPTGIVILGAGFGGLRVHGGTQLGKQAGIDDFVVLEKRPALGGVWRDNSYPGARRVTPNRTSTAAVSIRICA
ncbi:hypothetical protein ACTMU2_16820 [Cupriavidus basilensis]